MEGPSVVLEDLIKHTLACFSDDRPQDAIKKLTKLETAVAEGKCKDASGAAVDSKHAKYA